VHVSLLMEKQCNERLRSAVPAKKSSIVKFLNSSNHFSVENVVSLFACGRFCIFQCTNNAHLLNFSGISYNLVG